MSDDTVCQSQGLRVLMVPDFRRDNPYQTLLSKALEKKGIAVDFHQGYRRVLPVFRATRENSHSFDLVHLHWISPYLKGEQIFVKGVYAVKFLIDIALTRLSGLQIVWTVHNRVSHNTRFPGLELWTRRVLAKLVNKIIVHNHSSLAAIAQDYQFHPSKAMVIPHGHYREIYGPSIDQVAARQELGLPLDAKIYLNLGMLRPYKGLERLITLWQREKHSLGGGLLFIAGKPIDKAYGFQLAAQIAQTQEIKLYPEFIESGRISLFFSAADVVVLPFTNVLTSGSLILAMSYAKPIIAPRLGGVAETIGRADQLLYDPEDKQGLLRALKKSTHTNLEQISQLVENICQKHTWEHIGEKTLKLYKLANHQKNNYEF